ncbi:translation initiation factor IF-2 [Candidatus Poriferisocius sp.]|uniref:translation initiation factor IF-2 n=1 Tax=Candidatus Poriferisocius sp. TaxID=3101276 RepID=UPI003B019199
MPPSIRIYELARELGLENKETLDLCVMLGIGVKSHSSSIVDAQADRVRRRAHRDGLVRPPEPEPEPEPVVVEAEPVVVEPEPEPVVVVEAEPVVVEPEPEPVVVVEPEPEPVEPEPEPEPEPVVVVEPEPEPVVEAKPEPASKPVRVVTSSGGAPPRPRPVVPPAEFRVPGDSSSSPPRPASRPAPEPPEAQPAASARPSPPLSRSGKPIPPPPGRPPMSSSGKPIPPPPGRGGRGPAPPSPRRGPRGPARPAGATRGPATGSPGRAPAPIGARGPAGAGALGGPPGGGGGPGGRGRGGPQRPQQRRRKSRRRRRVAEDLQPMNVPAQASTDAAAPVGEVVIERASTPLEVGPKLNRTAADVVRFLMQQGEMVIATQSLTDDMIELFAAEVGAEVRLVDPGEEQENELLKLLEAEDDGDEFADDHPVRPPVITVMGHVDHGKTKLLDQIRNANVADGEAGGITQHIGAYQVDKNDRTLTFIDTPGHAAFTAMRARGADATDIVVLVVAADDGVMPQTLEAINHARAAEVPIVVAINKIDRNNADPNRTMQQLSEHDLVPEQWGGDTVMVEISALRNLGIDDLLEHLAVVAELEDLRADPQGRARGVVLESNLDIGRGPVATLLVQQGTLKRGDPVVAGASWGRVRALLDDRGQPIQEAQPSKPVQVLGLSDVAGAGDAFVVAPNEKVAAKVVSTREHSQRLASLGRDASAGSGGARLEDIFGQIQAGEVTTLNLIVKADVNGSLEAVVDSLKRLEREEVRLAFVHLGVGGVTANDIQLAAASNATIIGFNVRPDRKARELAELEKVEIRTYEIIYKLIEDVENAMVGMLAPEFEEVVTGDAEVREVFRVPRVGAVAGCYVLNGAITRGSKVRFLRDGTVIWRGTVSSLRRFKDDVREVQSGFECGIGLSDFQDLKNGDIIETFEEREVARV